VHPERSPWLLFRRWWDDVPEPDKGIVTAGAAVGGLLVLLLFVLVLSAG
jgi:hypothetical protein